MTKPNGSRTSIRICSARRIFFLELQDHGLDLDEKVMPMVHRLAADTDIPLVVTNDSHLSAPRRCPGA